MDTIKINSDSLFAQAQKLNELIKPMEFSNDLYKMVYGEDVNIAELKSSRTIKEIWYDITKFLAKDDIIKIEKIRNMTVSEVFTFLESKLKSIPKIEPEKTIMNPIGFKPPTSN